MASWLTLSWNGVGVADGGWVVADGGWVMAVDGWVSSRPLTECKSFELLFSYVVVMPV